jgi:hypothetical protein
MEKQPVSNKELAIGIGLVVGALLIASSVSVAPLVV